MAMCLVHIILQGLGCGRRNRVQTSPGGECSEEPSAGEKAPEGRQSMPLVVRLPEALQAQVVSYAGAEGSLSLCLTCRRVYTEIWESPRLWAALLKEPVLRTAQELRDAYRWQLFGIASLAEGQWPLATDFNATAALRRAESAVGALLPRDGPHAPRIISALTDLIRAVDKMPNTSTRVPDTMTHSLISAVTARPDIFAMEQTLELASAHHQRPRPCMRHRKPRMPCSSPCVGRTPARKSMPAREATRDEAAQDEVMGRLAFMLNATAFEVHPAAAAA